MNVLHTLRNRISGFITDHTVLLTHIACLIVSFLFMLAFSFWTSPYYKNWYGCDASFFTLVGRGMLNGKIPYRDFYDLKGPYFFFIQALGQLIRRGQTGIFVSQTAALFFSLILIYRIGRLYISHKKTLGVMAFFLWPYVAMIWGGNCLEEFCLPLNLLVIYLNLKVYGAFPQETYVNADDDVPDIQGSAAEGSTKNTEAYINRTAMITGICFGIMTFSKITAGAPLIGLTIGIFMLHIIRREFKPLIFNMLYFILGTFISFVPLLIYYGYHGSILKMLYCTFVFGFKRSSDLSQVLSLNLEIKLTGVIFVIVFALLHTFGRRKKAESDRTDDSLLPRSLSILLLPMAVVTYLALHLGDAFIYYFITEMPCLITALILFLRLYDPLILFKTLKQSICWMLLFIFVFHFTKDSINSTDMFIHGNDDEFQKAYYTNSKNMGALIPAYDRNSVFSFDIDMQWYEINGILPCNRYPINLQYFIALEPSIESDLFEFLEKTPPKWMICSNTLQDYLPKMNEIILSKYDCIYSTDVGLVYLLRE